MVKVLFITSHDRCPRAWKMATTLSKHGYSVSLLEWDRTNTLPRSEIIEKIHVHRMKLSAPYGPLLFLFMPIWWSYLLLFILINHYDIVQPENLDNSLPILPILKAMGISIVYDISDFYADAFIPPRLELFRTVISKIERFVVKSSNSCIIPDVSRVSQIGLSELFFTIINNSLLDTFEKCGRSSNVILNDNFTILYAGLLQQDRGIHFMTKSVENLENVELFIAGFGQLERELPNIIRGKSNIKFLNRLSYDEILKLTSQCDCVFAFYDPATPNHIFASPNKLFQAMMSSRPIIVNSGTSLANLVDAQQCGLIVDYGDVTALRASINILKNSPVLASKLGNNGRKAYSTKFSWQIMERRLLTIYRSLKISSLEPQ